MLNFIIKGLATWRLSHMLVNEDGPKSIFSDFRERTGIETNYLGNPVCWPDWNPLTCVWCTSVWVAVLVWRMPKVFSYILALSSIACILDSVTDKLEK